MEAIVEKRIMFPEYEPVSLRENVPGISEEGLEILQGMIVNDPKKRLSTGEILRHPYFRDVSSLLPDVVLEYVNRIHP